jgi:sugar/nucleoside kinase (ribokinase family)
MLPALLLLLNLQPNQLPPNLPPEIYAWFWTAPEFEPGGAEKYLDQVASRTNYGMLTTSLRLPGREITDPSVHDRVKQAVQYAHQRGLRVAFDLDPRLARGAFERAHPDQMQWMLRVRRVEPGEVTIPALRLDDHMTAAGSDYERLSGRFVGAWTEAMQPARV